MQQHGVKLWSTKTPKPASLDRLTPYLVNGEIPAANYNDVVKALHTSAVESSLASFGRNYLLDDIPSPERRLPRAQRTALAQLRTEECRLLRDYQLLVKLRQQPFVPNVCYVAIQPLTYSIVTLLQLI